MSKEAKILLGVGLVIIAGGIILAVVSSKHAFVPPADPGKLVRDESHMTGTKDAKVTVVEFGDYQCPFCGQFSPTIQKMLADYKANPNFNFVFRNFPLPQHEHAKIAAEAAEAAGAQGKYWEMNEKLYANQNTWVASSSPIDVFTQYAQELGLDVNKFRDEVQHNAYSNQIQTDLADVNALGLNSTPTLFINGEKQTSAPTYDILKAQIETELKK